MPLSSLSVYDIYIIVEQIFQLLVQIKTNCFRVVYEEKTTFNEKYKYIFKFIKICF